MKTMQKLQGLPEESPIEDEASVQTMFTDWSNDLNIHYHNKNVAGMISVLNLVNSEFKDERHSEEKVK